MDCIVNRVGAVQIISIQGQVDRQAAGTLYDVLITCVNLRGVRVIVDLSRVTRMTRAGSRGLVVAAKLAQRTGGHMRVCGAKPMVSALLKGLGHDPILKLDRTLAEALFVLGETDVHPIAFDRAPQTVASTTPRGPIYSPTVSLYDRLRRMAAGGLG